ncbi:hypothetical protein EC973_004036 [Apophysomyces ossiformis]|uniref:ubiquitinyl hydrolase 1 n=1 Tax=Apophysomyces ossiformis TaxID=679940 RepID=A0A8H7BQB7_9FUNG|nr:hypothetical protein EC973_004036 [Apophysomyces ossiformis]
MDLQNPQTTPLPQPDMPNDTTATATTVCDNEKSNVSNFPEMELEPRRAEVHTDQPSAGDNDTLQSKKDDDKQNVQDLDTILPGLLPENADLETEDTRVYHWHINDWKSLAPRSHSPEFQAGGFPWRILLFPKGNNQQESLSVYLEVADPAAHGHPENWHVCAQFSLVISNLNDPTNYYNNNANHRFSSEEVDWGFTRFYELKSLTKTANGKGPFIVNNQTVISVFVRVVKDETGVLWHNFINYDSRKETGYVGIKNQGATCYMNSLLQSLYCTNSFRKAVYQIPTETEEPTKSVALALQRCFYNLQYSNVPIDTTELTKSFGWDSLDAFMQHDVQEFNRVLQDNLELKMKNTPADGAISNLFVGKMKSYIKCINVDYESSRVEDYYDYITVETLEGENKYMAEGHGLQDANKGVIFESFPPVLHLQLKRFEYDFMRDTMVKINDHYEFPNEINLDEFCSNSDKEGPYDYVLHGVLVHSGDLHGGHYFALIKPEKDGKWLRFDDDRVTPVTKKEVFEENFGDESTVKAGSNAAFPNGVMRSNSIKMLKRFTNAYMLVYIRKNQLDKVLGSMQDDDIPPHLKKRLNEEKAALEKRRKEREEMHLYVKVAIVTDESFKTRQEFDLAVFDDKNLEATPGVDILKVLKSEKVVNFKAKLAEYYNLEPDQFRLWSILSRTNKTVRVDSPLSSQDEKGTVERLRELSCVATPNNGLAKLYLETLDNNYTKFPNKKDTSIVFLKYFDIYKQEMRGLGRMYIKANDKVGEIIPTLVERAELPKDTAITLFEEVKPTMIEFMTPKQTFSVAEIQNGDIICFQVAVDEKEAKKMVEQGRHATVRAYFGAIQNRVIILFKPKVDKRGQEVKLQLNRRSTYYQVARELGKALGAEPTKIRFTTANSVTNKPKEVLPYSASLDLEQMAPMMPTSTEYAQALSLDSVRVPVVYYEILDYSIMDLETKRFMKIHVLGDTLREEATLTVLVPKTGFVRDLAEEIQTKNKLDPQQLRLYEVSEGKIVKEFSLDQPIDNVGDKLSVLYAEDETEMDMDNDRLIQVVHYHKDAKRYHGVPFRFVAKKGETFADTKKRLQKRTGMSDKEWQKVKFAVIKGLGSGSEEVIPIDKDDVELRTMKINDEDALGLNHVDKSSRASRFGGFLERGIFIRG